MSGTLATIKLNFFQRLMRCWSQLGAYNAVHVIRVSGKADLDRWQQATLATVNAVGLGHPQLNSKEEIYFLPLTLLTIETPTVNLEDHVNHELNRTFSTDEFPLRFFSLSRDDDTHYFGVTYHHWIADAYAMRMLLQHIVAHYRRDAQLPPALTLHAPAFQSLFRHHLGWFPSLLWLREMLRSLKLFNNAYRPSFKNSLDFHSQYVFQTLSTETLTKIKSYCNKHHVTLNDLFIALLAQVMGRFSTTARYRNKSYRIHGKRDRIAISIIADIRYAANQPLEQVLGQYLSSYTVVIATPEQRSTDAIVQEVYQYTSRIKKSARIVRSHYNFETALRLWDWNPDPKRRASLFHKYSPICAGISNVHVRDDALSKEDSHGKVTVLDYWRVSPTGPLSPLVFSITTFRERPTICLAYRCSALSKEVAAQLCQNFCQELATIVE